RSVVAGVHRLKEIEDFRAAYFTNDNAFRPHAQTVLHQITHRDLALAFKIRRAGFEAHDMRLLKLQFGRVFAGDDALITVDIVGQAVEQHRLSGTGTAGNDDIAADAADDFENFGSLRRDRTEAYQLVKRQLVLLELADGQRCAIDSQRRGDDVDAGTVWQAR